MLVLRLQLARLRAEPSFERLRDQVKSIAGLLEEKTSIPMVRDQLALIQAIQSDEYWQDVTLPMLETVRRRLRALIKLIEKARRRPVYTNFEDQLGDDVAVSLPGFESGIDFERFRAKARQFLRAHEEHAAVRKVRWNQPLTSNDLAELERLLLDGGVGGPVELGRAKKESQGLGLFIRSLVGLDREAAKQAFGQFLVGTIASANQVEFINLIVDHLTEHSVMSPSLVYESPFTDVTPRGPDGLFISPQLHELLAILDHVRSAALAA